MAHNVTFSEYKHIKGEIAKLKNMKEVARRVNRNYSTVQAINKSTDFDDYHYIVFVKRHKEPTRKSWFDKLKKLFRR